MSNRIRYSSEVKELAVRMVLEHQNEYSSQGRAICSLAAKIGCTGETLRSWLWQAERDQGLCPGLTSKERERNKQLEKENRELRRVNDILRKASAYFAQAELGHRRRGWCLSSTPSARAMGWSRSARYCRSTRPPTMNTRPARPIQDV